MDTIFTMMSMDQTDHRRPETDLLFQSLVHICELLEDKKFQHFKSVMDTYINNYFCATLVHRCIYTTVTFILQLYVYTCTDNTKKCLIKYFQFNLIIFENDGFMVFVFTLQGFVSVPSQ